MQQELRSAQVPVVFHLNGIGDRLLALPALRALSQLYPGRIRLVGAPGDSSLFFYQELGLMKIHEVRATTQGTERSIDAEALRQAVGTCDLFLCFNTWHATGVSELLEGFPATTETVGLYRRYKHWVRGEESQHALDRLFALAQRLVPTLRLEDFAQAPVLTAEATAAARNFRDSVPAGARVLALHTETGSRKQWPVARYRAVLEAFLERHPEWLVLNVDFGATALEPMVHGGRVLAAQGASLDMAMALLGACDGFLGIDSCMLHAADFFRLPSVGLFGTTSPLQWGFRLTPAFRELTGNGSMDDITEDAVLGALTDLAAGRLRPA
ncbi:hypothetical protein HUW63_13725 [Myxococcus sp. AM001]|nr:hypothetical protein [Myxococcus sp. AM001]